MVKIWQFDGCFFLFCFVNILCVIHSKQLATLWPPTWTCTGFPRPECVYSVPMGRTDEYLSAVHFLLPFSIYSMYRSLKNRRGPKLVPWRYPVIISSTQCCTCQCKLHFYTLLVPLEINFQGYYSIHGHIPRYHNQTTSIFTACANIPAVL